MSFQVQRIGLGASSFSASPFQAVAGVRKNLGQAEQSWYARAKSAVVEYGNLWDRAQKVNDKGYRDELATKYHGNPAATEGALYRRNSVAFNIAEAESHTPISYDVFKPSEIQDRVNSLEDLNKSFKPELEAGEKKFGVLAETQPVEVGVAAKGKSVPGWVVPSVVCVGLFALGFFIFKD